MQVIGGWLLVVGVCDLLRAARDTTTTARRSLVTALGVVLMLFVVVVLELREPLAVALAGVMVLSVGVWVLSSSAALEAGPGVSKLTLTLAFGSLLTGLAATGLGGGLAGTSLEMPSDIQGSLLTGQTFDEVALLLGVAMVQLSTANVLVRLLLNTVGIPATTNEKQLKGGRLLGPMERVFIIGLGLAGQLTAAAVVVAAKGLLRFPELQRDVAATGQHPDGPSDVTEYFLIGSFASWLLALGGLGLLAI